MKSNLVVGYWLLALSKFNALVLPTAKGQCPKAMIIRIVRMHFTEAGLQEFLEIFHANKIAIRNFEGCTHLELLKDLDNEFIYTTLSHWRDHESLDRYRKSELFASVWGRVKTLFAERTQAFSLIRYVEM